jgi:hypothetical protein
MSKIIITLTADWEGEHFKNLNDFIGIRKFIGKHIPITHFITASYFTNTLKNAPKKIQSALYEGDEIGMHIHCLRSLVREAGVDFISEPDFFEPFTPEVRSFINLMPKVLRPKVSGRGVPVSAYPEEDIYKLLKVSVELISKHLNTENPISFRAGGWMASDAVLRSLMKLNFKYDSSAAPPEILSRGYSENSQGNWQDEYGGKNGKFTSYILKIWGNELQTEHFVKNSLFKKHCPDPFIQKTTQPFIILNLTEMPNNAGVSDYASATGTMLFLVKKAISEIKNGRQTPFFINLGFHQEGEIKYKMPIVEFFNMLSQEDRQFIEFKTLSEAWTIADKLASQI